VFWVSGAGFRVMHDHRLLVHLVGIAHDEHENVGAFLVRGAQLQSG